MLEKQAVSEKQYVEKTKQLPKKLQVYLQSQTKYQATDFCGVPQASSSPGSNHHSSTCPGQFYKKL